MLIHLIGKEMLDQISSLRFLVLALIGAVAIWLSLYTGYSYYSDRLDDYHLAEDTTRQRILQLESAWDWWELISVGFNENNPPSPLMVFVRGLDPYLGREISNDQVLPHRLRHSPVEAQPVLSVFPSLGLDSLIGIVFSVLVLLLIFDTISGEKETGTLRLVAAQGLPIAKLLIAKLLGVLIPVGVAIGLPLALGIGVLTMMPDFEMDASEWERSALIMTVSAAYLFAYACAGLLGSALTYRSAASVVLLLTFWITTVVVIPRTCLIVAETIQPAPSIYRHQAERENLSRQFLMKWREERVKWQTNFDNTHGYHWRSTPESREEERYVARRTRREIYVEQRLQAVRQLEEDFRRRYNRRMELAISIARISPAFAYKDAMVRLARSSVERHRGLEDAFEQSYFGGGYYDWYLETTDRWYLKEANPEKYGKAEWDLAGMPRFSLEDREESHDAASSVYDLGIIVTWGLLSLICAWASMIRYDVR